MKPKYRADGTYIIRTESTDNPKLGAKLLSDGRESLFLDFNYGYSMQISSRSGRLYPKKNRRRVYLRLYIYPSPHNSEQRTQNRDTLYLAKRIRYERAQQLLEQTRGYRLPAQCNTDLLQWMQQYHDSYLKSDRSHIRRARTCFIDYLHSDPALQHWGAGMHPDALTPKIVEGFAQYLRRRFSGEGPNTLFARFKKIIRAALDAGVIKKDPCRGISILTDSNALRKDVLSLKEIQKLEDTRFEGEHLHVRRAFLFCCYTGLRWCDVRRLTMSNIDLPNRLLRFEQAKTRGHSSASSLILPLSPKHLELILNPDHPESHPSSDSLLFPIPGHKQCLRILARWTAHAGITKHITWHCARHSFAVNILNRGANIKTLSSLLGHSTLRHTEKYTRALDPLKQAALESLLNN